MLAYEKTMRSKAKSNLKKTQKTAFFHSKYTCLAICATEGAAWGLEETRKQLCIKGGLKMNKVVKKIVGIVMLAVLLVTNAGETAQAAKRVE